MDAVPLVSLSSPASISSILGHRLDSTMDLQSALAVLLRPQLSFASPFPLSAFSMPSDAHSLLTISQLGQLGCASPTLNQSASLSAFAPQSPVKKAKMESPPSPQSSSSSTTTLGSSQMSSPQPSPQRKPPTAIPDDKKDAAYFERRRKNNDAAKRSRDARRQKEEAVAARAALLEQENLQLRSQVQLLKNETAKLQLMLFSSSPQNKSHTRPGTIETSNSAPEEA